MSTRTGLRWPAAAALTLAVLGGHWLLLRSTDAALKPGERLARPVALQLRTVPMPVPAPPPAAPPVTAPAITRQAAAARTPAPTPTPAQMQRTVHRQRAAMPDPERALATAAATVDAAPPTMVAAAQPAPLEAVAVAVPSSATLHYRATARYRGIEVDGTAQLQWQHDSSQYQAQLQIGLPMRPARVQRSSGAITLQGLAPLRFSDRNRSEEATHFDRVAQRIVFSSNRPPVALEPGAQDRLSVLLQLQALVAAEPSRYPVGSSLRLQTAGTREADDWRFTVDALEPLALPGGTVQALRLTRLASREHENLFELWLGPGPDYAPVRLRLTQPGGDWLDLQWSGTDRG